MSISQPAGNTDPLADLPYRGPGPNRPALPLPPEKMPLFYRGRPLKRWRYVGAYGPEVMVCGGVASVGPARQSFWAVWDRENGKLIERTRLVGGKVAVPPGGLTVDEDDLQIELSFKENDGVEVVSQHGRGYIWTRKQAGVIAAGKLVVDGELRKVSAAAIVDESTGYHARHTAWQWSAGVGTSTDGQEVAWNLVSGVHDSPTCSERTVWIDGKSREVGPVKFADDLSAVESVPADRTELKLAFTAESERQRDENLLLIRSNYTQPFGTFTGKLTEEVELAEGFGVMERHEAWW